MVIGMIAVPLSDGVELFQFYRYSRSVPMSKSPIQFVDTFPTGVVPLSEVALHLHPEDNVVIARVVLQSGTVLKTDETTLTVRQFIPSGHKVALHAIAAGQPV